jgi:hypothetical protein
VRFGGGKAWALLSCALALGLVACSSDAVSSRTAEVARNSGLKQCGEEAPAPEAFARVLEANGLRVLSFACASDGLLRAQVCGSDRGLYYVYAVGAHDVAKALGLGFTDIKQISRNPGYRRFACKAS